MPCEHEHEHVLSQGLETMWLGRSSCWVQGCPMSDTQAAQDFGLSLSSGSERTRNTISPSLETGVMRQPSVVVGCLLQLLSLSQAHSSLEQYYDAFLPIQKAAEAEEEMQRKSGLVQVQAQGEPPRPVIPRRFGANMHVFTTSMGTPTKGRGYFAQDVDLKANRVESLASYFIQGADSNMTTLSIGNMTWIETGGNHPNCRYLPMMGRQGFHDLFAWASNPTLSEYAGQRSVAGRSCALWRFRFGSSAVNQSLCTDGNSPVELNISYRNLLRLELNSKLFGLPNLVQESSSLTLFFPLGLVEK